MNNSKILIYQAADGNIKIDVRLEDETVWLTQDHMARLLGKARSTINEHIKNIFAEGELVEADVMKKFGISEFQQKAALEYAKFRETQRHIQHEESLKELEEDIKKLKPPLEKGGKS